MSLEFIIGVKAGIGRTFEEAEEALKQTKNLKEKISSQDSIPNALQKIHHTLLSKQYAFIRYEGPSLATKNDSLYTLRQTVDFDVFQTITNLNKVLQQYGENSLAYRAVSHQIEKRCIDDSTTALTPFGYHFKIAHEINPHRNLHSNVDNIYRYRVIVDANDMHFWNDKLGYDKVSAQLNIIGKTLVQSTRKTTPERVGDLIFRPILVSRMHGSAGDEFFLDLYCPEDSIKPLVERVLDKIYSTQLESRIYLE